MELDPQTRSRIRARITRLGLGNAGDYVEIDALSKSKTGSTLEATQIDRRFVAAQNVHFAAALRITQTTLTTTTAEPMIVPVPVVATTFKTTETVQDGKTTVTQSKSTTVL